MTIVVSVQVSEGLVLAADSATTVIMRGPGGARVAAKVWPHAKKLFHIKDYPIGALAWGEASLAGRNIPSLIYEFEKDLPSRKRNKGFEVKTIANNLRDFMFARYEKQFRIEKGEEPFGMAVCGYSDGDFFPEQYYFEFPRQKSIESVRPIDEEEKSLPGAAWFGLDVPLIRLVKGYEPRLREHLEEHLSTEKVDDILGRFELAIPYTTMPLQDAIDMAIWLVETVIGAYRFVIGAPMAGGEIDVAVIYHKGFIWIRRKTWHAYEHVSVIQEPSPKVEEEMKTQKEESGEKTGTS